VSIVAERTNETCTPRLRCTPEQFRHRKMPCLMEHQSGLDAAQSAHVCDGDDDGDDDLLVHVERVSVAGRRTRHRTGDENSARGRIESLVSLSFLLARRRRVVSPRDSLSRATHAARGGVPFARHDARSENPVGTTREAAGRRARATRRGEARRRMSRART
jgi:hypothetical protein